MKQQIRETIKNNWIRKMKKVLKIIWRILGVIYAPIYVAFWLLHKVARLLLAISYFGMFEKQVGKDIILNLFNWYGRR
jgi:hypothetical protein|nr:MAG TPA: hypothetical protein [Caudoviricetes sp.]